MYRACNQVAGNSVHPYVQRGINMVDLIFTMIIGVIITTFVIQSIIPYYRASIIYQMKSDIDIVVDLSGWEGTKTGNIEAEEIDQAVTVSEKSPGVGITWGKVDSGSAPPPSSEETAQAFTLDAMPSIERVSFISASESGTESGTESEGTLSEDVFVLVAQHKAVPDLRVVYFFDSYYGPDAVSDGSNDTEETNDGEVEKKGNGKAKTEKNVIPVEKMPEIKGGTYVAPKETKPKPDPTVEPTPEPSEAAAPPKESPSPEPTDEHSHENEPEPSPSPTAEEKEPLPPPSQNYDRKSSKFPLCHGPNMNYIELPISGIMNGHHGGNAGHEKDIIPPIPAHDYEGWNWTYETSRTFYNDCTPVQ